MKRKRWRKHSELASRFSLASLFVSSRSSIDRDTRQFRPVWEIVSQSKSAARSIIISQQHRDIALEQFVPRQEFFLVKHEETLLMKTSCTKGKQENGFGTKLDISSRYVNGNGSSSEREKMWILSKIVWSFGKKLTFYRKFNYSELPVRPSVVPSRNPSLLFRWWWRFLSSGFLNSSLCKSLP